MPYKYLIVAVFSALFVSCQCSKKKQVAFYDEDDTEESVTDSSYNYVDTTIYYTPDYNDIEVDESDIVSVPFVEKGGVKYVDVSVNGFGFQMIFDTGCSSTLISVAEANYLYEKGYLTVDDVIGVTQSQIADGSIVENMVVNLKEVIIADQIRCPDVKATVSSNNKAPLLLGNEILNRAAAYAVDNENQVIRFKLK